MDDAIYHRLQAFFQKAREEGAVDFATSMSFRHREHNRILAHQRSKFRTSRGFSNSSSTLIRADDPAPKHNEDNLSNPGLPIFPASRQCQVTGSEAHINRLSNGGTHPVHSGFIAKSKSAAKYTYKHKMWPDFDVIYRIAKHLRSQRQLRAPGNDEIERTIFKQMGDYLFHGEVWIENREEAFNFAQRAFSRPSPHRLDLWTDGSTHKEQGASGAAACYMKHNKKGDCVSSMVHLPRITSIDLAEFVAIGEALALALPWAVETMETSSMLEEKPIEVHVFSDSKAALRWIAQLSQGRINEAVTQLEEETTRKVLTRSYCLSLLRVGLRLHWVPGHVGVVGNEFADSLANAARLSRNRDAHLDLGLAMMQSRLRRFRVLVASSEASLPEFKGGREEPDFPEVPLT